MTQEQLIDEFLSGAEEGACAGGKNLKIKGNKLIHYQTVIAQRHGNKFVINITRYSLVTGRLQKILCQKVPEDKQIVVKRVKEGFQGNLEDYLAS